LSEKAEVLAREIAGEGASAEILELARPIAGAELDLTRARRAQLEILLDDMEAANAKALDRE